MEQKPFEILTHTADVAIGVWGIDVAELLRNAARGLYCIVLTEDSEVRPTITRQISLESVDSDTLLIDWMNELIYMIDAEQLLFSMFEFDELEAGYLKARVHGEYLDLSRHQLRREVKAATYHMSQIEASEQGLKARIILDV